MAAEVESAREAHAHPGPEKLRAEAGPVAAPPRPHVSASLRLRACTVDLATGERTPALPTGRLSLTERRLLAHLVANAGRVIAREELLREVWHWRARSRTRAVDAAMRRLRERLEADPARPDHLYTVHGVGFRFVLDTEPAATGDADPTVLTTLRSHRLAVVASVTDRLLQELAGQLGASAPPLVDLSGCQPELQVVRVARALGLGPMDDPDTLRRALRELGPAVVGVIGVDPDRVRGWLDDAPTLLVVVQPAGAPPATTPAAPLPLDAWRRIGRRDQWERLAVGVETIQDPILLAEVAEALGLPRVRAWALDRAVAAGGVEALLRRAAVTGVMDLEAARAQGVGPELALWEAEAERADAVRRYDRAGLVAGVARVVPLARAAGRWDLVRAALYDAARALQWEGRIQEALALHAELRLACKETGFAAHATAYGAAELLARAELSEPDELDADADELLRTIRSPDVAPINPTQLVQLAAVLWQLERDAEARALLWEAAESARRLGRLPTEVAATSNLALCDWLDGRCGKAVNRLHEALHLMRALPAGTYRALALAHLGTLLRDPATLADAARAAAGDPRMEAFVQVRALVLPGGGDMGAAWNEDTRQAARLYRGVAALAEGGRDAAEEALAAAPRRLLLQGRLARALLVRELKRV